MLEDYTRWLINQWNLFRNSWVISRMPFQYLALRVSHSLVFFISKNYGPATVLFLCLGRWFGDGNPGPILSHSSCPAVSA